MGSNPRPSEHWVSSYHRLRPRHQTCCLSTGASTASDDTHCNAAGIPPWDALERHRRTRHHTSAACTPQKPPYISCRTCSLRAASNTGRNEAIERLAARRAADAACSYVRVTEARHGTCPLARPTAGRHCTSGCRSCAAITSVRQRNWSSSVPA